MASPEWPAALRRAALCCWANSLERPPGFAETPGSQLGLPALPMAISFMLHRVLLTLLTLHWATAALASKGLGAASLEIVACDTLKDRARSACTAPSARLWMTS